MSATYLQHQLSAIFARMDDVDHAKLTADIGQNGQRDPIIIYEGEVLDGWHRYLSCLELGITPRFQVLPPETDPAAYVISCNLHRRHLTGSQRAEAVAASNSWVAAHRPSNSAPSAGLTTKAMAEKADVGTRTIEHVKAAHAAGLGEAVRDGKITAKQGAAIAKLPVEERAAAVENPDILKVTKHAPERKKAITAEASADQIVDNAIMVLAGLRKDDPERLAALMVVRAYIDSEVQDGEIVTMTKEEFNYLSSMVDKAEIDQEALEVVLNADDRLAEAATQIRLLTAEVATLTNTRNDCLYYGKDETQALLNKQNVLIKELENKLASYLVKHETEGVLTGGSIASSTNDARTFGRMISALRQFFLNWRKR